MAVIDSNVLVSILNGHKDSVNLLKKILSGERVGISIITLT